MGGVGMSVFSASLRGVPIGAGSVWLWESPPVGFGGLSTVGARSQRMGRDGAVPQGPDLLPARTVTFEVFTEPGDPAVAEQRADELVAAWQPVRSGVLPLTVELTQGEWLLFGRPRSAPVDLAWLPQGVVRARLVFEALDPRFFSASEHSVSIGLTVGGGMTFPLTFPLTFGAGSDSDVSVVNAGSFETDWSATIVGPVTTPRLTLAQTGEFVELDGSVPAGSTLALSSVDGAVLLNGSPRPGWPTLRSRFWRLPSGSSTVRFRAAAGSGSCTFAWRDAKI